MNIVLIVLRVVLVVNASVTTTLTTTMIDFTQSHKVTTAAHVIRINHVNWECAKQEE
jgi:hypothetical protein